MIIRELRLGEEKAWLKCGLSEKSKIDELLPKFTHEFHENKQTKQHIYLVAVSQNEIVGKLKTLKIAQEEILITALVIEDQNNYQSYGTSLINYLKDICNDKTILGTTWDEEKYQPMELLLLQNNFKMYVEKQYIEKEIINYQSPYEKIFDFKSLKDTGKESFLSIYAGLFLENKSRDFAGKTPEQDFSELVEYAGEEFNAEFWEIVYYQQRPVGVVMPQIYPDSNGKEGGLFNWGFLPTYRGKGWGKVLHSYALERLSQMGVTMYIDSTDIENEAMLKVFEKNQCKKVGIRKQYIYPE